MSRRRGLGLAARALLAAALTGGILFLWLRAVDREALARSLGSARPGWIAAVGAFSLLHLAVRAHRWHGLLAPAGDVPPRRRLLAWIAISYAVTFVAPGRAGEAVRPALAWARGGVPAGIALGSVALDRLLDVATLLVLLGAYVVIAPETPGVVAQVAVIGLAVVVLGGGAGLVVVRTRRSWLERLAAFLPRLAPRRFEPKMEGLSRALVASLEVLVLPGAWWRLPLWSFATWTPVLLAIAAALKAARLDEVPLTAVLLLVPLTALGIAVPTPAGVGGYHAAMTYGLVEGMGVESGAAAAASIVAHAASVIPVMAAGLLACWTEGLSPADLRRSVEAARSPALDAAATIDGSGASSTARGTRGD
jgi:uncharacterized membrane protein YbhN (UPF0104 family)